VQRLARLTRNQWMPIRRKSETHQIGKNRSHLHTLSFLLPFSPYNPSILTSYLGL